MMSYGSGTGINYDQRWPTDGIVFENSSVRFNDITDGASNTVFMSESIRSTGADMTLTAGTTPTYPYQYTLNGSTGLNSTLQSTQGIPVTGGSVDRWHQRHEFQSQSVGRLAPVDGLARGGKHGRARSRRLLGRRGSRAVR